MKEFSSYYFAKANEIPQSHYIDIAYFEAMSNNSNKVQQALPSHTKQQQYFHKSKTTYVRQTV